MNKHENTIMRAVKANVAEEAKRNFWLKYFNRRIPDYFPVTKPSLLEEGKGLSSEFKRQEKLIRNYLRLKGVQL